MLILFDIDTLLDRGPEADSGALYPDAAACLESVAQHRRGLATARGSAHLTTLERFGMLDRFDCVLALDGWDAPGPDPGVFRRASAEAGKPLDQVIYVGAIRERVAAAREAGLAGVWLDRRGEASAADAPPVIGALCELPWTVEAIESGPRAQDEGST